MAEVQQDALEELQLIEKKVVNIVRTASLAVKELTSDAFSTTPQSVEHLAAAFFKEVSEVETSLRGQIQRLAVNAPYRDSSYGAEKDVDLLAWHTDLIDTQLQAMLKDMEDTGVKTKTEEEALKHAMQ
eukprot:comp6735_c0_seq1/m.2511 comp6735_c0_seq1/g.2511  ORF comp6735_c0_seq1/g.2511 comp6735_c0_seq1/m.2511 type:complete len:128 (-) comp6735_c0_seq1:534-917(-)